MDQSSDTNYILLAVISIAFISACCLLADYMGSRESVSKPKGDEKLDSPKDGE